MTLREAIRESLREAMVNGMESLWLEVATGNIISIGTAQHWDWIYDHIEELLPSLSSREKDIFWVGGLTLMDYEDWLDVQNFEVYYKSIGYGADYERLKLLIQELGYEGIREGHDKVQLKVYKSWTRIRFHVYDLYAQIYAPTKPYYDSLVRFLQGYSEKHFIRSITAEKFSLTDEGDVIWDNVSIQDALNSKSFRKI